MIKESPVLVLFDIILILFLYFVLRKSRKKPLFLSRFRAELSFFLFVIICLFSFYDTDWFHYQENISDLESYRYVEYGLGTNMEIGYISIVEFVNYNYLWFRLLVWGGALLLFRLTVKRYYLGLDASLFFLLPFIIVFSYGRVTLTMAIAFFLFSFIVKPIKRIKLIISFVVCALLILTISLLHKSSIVLVPVFILSLFPLRKSYLKWLVLSLVLIILLLEIVLLQYISMAESVDANYLDLYVSSNQGVGGAGELVYRIVSSIPFYAVSLFIVHCVSNGVYKNWPYYIKSFANATLWIVIIASAFLLTLNLVFYYRILYFSMLPSVITLSYAHSAHSEVHLIHRIQNLNILVLFYVLVYRFYLFLYI